MAEPSIRQLRYFVLVADSGSFRAAAELACRSPSALSLSIRELEAALGGQLFEPERVPRISDFGRRCLPMARDLVERYDEQLRTIKAGAVSATVTVAVLPSFASRWLPAFLSLFAYRHPDIALRVVDDNSRNIEQMVLERRADIGVLSRGPLDRRLDAEGLISDRFGLVCSRRHPLSGRKSIAWSALNGLPLLGNLTHQLLLGTQVYRFVESPRLFIANMTSLLSLVADGGWVSPIPVFAVPRREQDVIAVPLVQPVVEREIAIIRLKTEGLRLPVAAVQSAIREVVLSEASNGSTINPDRCDGA